MMKNSEIEMNSAANRLPVQSQETCGVVGCNSVPIIMFPCDCGMVICAECFREAVGKKGKDLCPVCQHPYDLGQMQSRSMGNKVVNWEDLDNENNGYLSNKSNYDSDTSDEGSGWQGENGGAHEPYRVVCGNDDDIYDSDDDDNDDDQKKKKRPLSKKMSISIVVLSIYRFVIFIRFVVHSLYLIWRVSNVNKDAVWLWGISLVCEIWFAVSWVLDQLPKLSPINRMTDLSVLKDKFDKKSLENPTCRSDLPGIDVFITTADPEKEPSLVTANSVLSILAAEYPVEKLACYVSDDSGTLLTYEAMVEAANFAQLWVPFCRKHGIEPRSPEAYFKSKRDPYNNKVRPGFVKDRRRLKHEYDKYKVRINALPDLIRHQSDANNAREDLEAIERQWQEEREEDEIPRFVNNKKATWMDNDCHWAGTWLTPTPNHMKGDHAGIVQVLLVPQGSEPQYGNTDGANGLSIDFTGVDMRIPMLVYVSREKRPGFDHHKKAGAMNALVRASAVMSNGPFILNLDCDHYVYNSQAFREAICFMMSDDGDQVAFIQFPQRFEGIDPSDRYANRNLVFFDLNMRALDGLQGPVYVGTGCMFRRIAIYGFDPPRFKIRNCYDSLFNRNNTHRTRRDEDDDHMNSCLPGKSHCAKKFGNSQLFLSSINRAEFEGRPLSDHFSGRNRREPGTLRIDKPPINEANVEEAIDVVSCSYEEKTGWGNNVGWVYGTITEDVVTGYKMHTRGWRSVYCLTKHDAFRGTAPINLTDKLVQVLRWATGSTEIFFSRNNAIFAGPRLMFLQRVAYLNITIYPFTSIFLVVFCFIPAMSLFSGEFIVNQLSVAFSSYLLVMTVTLCILAVLEIKWSGLSLDEVWRNEQFWVIGGTSSYLFAVFQVLLKIVGGIETSFSLTAKSSGAEDEDDEFAELYVVKWTSLMIPPITIMMVNIIAIAVGFTRTIYSNKPNWGKLFGGVFFSFWVLAHLYPFAKGVMGRRGKTPAIVFVWSGLVAITIALLFNAIYPPSPNNDLSGSFSFP